MYVHVCTYSPMGDYGCPRRLMHPFSMCVVFCVCSPGNAVQCLPFSPTPIALLVYNCPPFFLTNAPKSPLLIILGSQLFIMVGAEAYEQAGVDRKRNVVQIGAGAEDRGQEEEEAMDNKVRGHTHTHMHMLMHMHMCRR